MKIGLPISNYIPSREDLVKINKHPEKIKQMFSQVSYRYDFLNTILSVGRDKHWRHQTVKEISKNNITQLNLLDLCTGTGEIILELKRNTQKKNFCVGCDFSFDMLRIAKRKLQNMSKDNFFNAVISANSLHLPFISNFFDVVTIAFGIRNIHRIQACAKEVYRILKPNGLYAILEFALPENKVVKSVYEIYLSKFIPYIGAVFCGKNPSAYLYLSSSIFDFDSSCDLLKILSSSGFDLFSKFSFDYGIVYLNIFKKKGG